MDLNVVLMEPEIPPNTGAIGRICVGLGARLHLVQPLGFSLRHEALERAGLDYWQHLKYSVHETFEGFLGTLGPEPSLIFLSTRGKASYWEAPYTKDSCLIFGSEGAGLPAPMYEKYADRLYRIPMWSDHVRSINLSTSAGVVLYEALRQTGNINK